MKKNYLIALVLLVICFGLIIAAMVLQIKEETQMCVYMGMAASGAAFMSCLFGINSWKER